MGELGFIKVGVLLISLTNMLRYPLLVFPLRETINGWWFPKGFFDDTTTSTASGGRASADPADSVYSTCIIDLPVPGTCSTVSPDIPG